MENPFSKQNRGGTLFIIIMIVLLLFIIFPLAGSCQYKLDSAKYVSRGTYDMYLSNDTTCFAYDNYRAKTWKKKIRFAEYYLLTKNKRGWTLTPYKRSKKSSKQKNNIVQI